MLGCHKNWTTRGLGVGSWGVYYTGKKLRHSRANLAFGLTPKTRAQASGPNKRMDRKHLEKIRCFPNARKQTTTRLEMPTKHTKHAKRKTLVCSDGKLADAIWVQDPAVR